MAGLLLAGSGIAWTFPSSAFADEASSSSASESADANRGQNGADEESDADAEKAGNGDADAADDADDADDADIDEEDEDGSDKASDGEDDEDPDYSSMSLGTLKREVKKKTAELEELEKLSASLGARLDETSAHLDSVSAELAEQLAAAERSVRERYKVQNQYPSLIDAVLCAEDWQSFIAGIEYIEAASKASVSEVTDLRKEVEKYEQEKNQLEVQKAVTDKRLEKVSEQLEEATRARDEAQRKADLVANAHLMPDGADWDADEKDFVEEWAERIDEYLDGSPMEGQGEVFAQAAWDNHIDPRFSPAISHIESGKGRICIRSHNAWGWGAAEPNPAGLASSWPTWEDAINDHVSGLKAGYGYTITKKGAKKYCPPNWQLWYSITVNQMNSI